MSFVASRRAATRGSLPQGREKERKREREKERKREGEKERTRESTPHAPVELVEVDAIRLQPPERRVARGDDRVAVEPSVRRPRAGREAAGGARRGDARLAREADRLGRDHELVAHLGRRKEEVSRETMRESALGSSHDAPRRGREDGTAARHVCSSFQERRFLFFIKPRRGSSSRARRGRVVGLRRVTVAARQDRGTRPRARRAAAWRAYGE